MGNRRDSATIVLAVASEISSASSHSGLSGVLAEVQNMANTAAKHTATSAVSSQ